MNALLLPIALTGPIIAAIFATHAGWSWASAQYSPWVASAIVGSVYAGLASLAAGILLWRANRKTPREASPARSASPLALVELAMKHKPLETSATLMGLGALLARNPKLAITALSRLALTR